MYEESKMTDVLMNDLFTKSHICMYNPCEEINGNCDTYLNYFKSLLHNSIKYWLIVLKIKFDLDIPIIMINLFAKSHFSICEENEHKLPVDW